MAAVPTVRERTVDAAGTAIFVRESGSGSPVVLLHGFPETSRCWDKVAGALSAEHHVLAPDLPGYGRSPALALLGTTGAAAWPSVLRSTTPTRSSGSR